MKKWPGLFLCIIVCCQSPLVFAQNVLSVSEEKQEAAILQVESEYAAGTKDRLSTSETPAPGQTVDPIPALDADNTLAEPFTDKERGLFAPDVQNIQIRTAEPHAECSAEVTLNFENPASEAAGRMSLTGSFNENYGDQLGENALALYNGILSALQKGNPGSFIVSLPTPLSGTCSYTVVDGRRDMEEDLPDILFGKIRPDCISAESAFFYDHPEVFWVSSLSYGYDENCYRLDIDSNTATATFTLHSIQFTIDHEEWAGASSEISAFNASVSRTADILRASFTSSMTVAEKARAVHDYICNHVDYEYAALTEIDPKAYSAYGFFCESGEKRAVCEGYAKTFKILCDHLAIPCAIGAGQAVNSEGSLGNHMWNYVKADGSWYLVDVTWDDQKDEIYTVYFLAGSSTIGFFGITIGNERKLSSYNLDSKEGVAFVQPAIAANAYTSGASPSPTEGLSVTVKNALYTLSENNTAIYMYPVKKKKTVQIPAAIKTDGKNYAVKTIAAAAFRNNKKIRTITIGKNVTVIAKEAFRNAKNLKTLTIKSKKLVSIGAKAFKGTSKSLVIRVPKKKYSKYKTLLAKAGFKGKLVKY